MMMIIILRSAAADDDDNFDNDDDDDSDEYDDSDDDDSDSDDDDDDDDDDDCSYLNTPGRWVQLHAVVRTGSPCRHRSIHTEGSVLEADRPTDLLGLLCKGFLKSLSSILGFFLLLTAFLLRCHFYIHCLEGLANAVFLLFINSTGKLPNSYHCKTSISKASLAACNNTLVC